MSANIDNRFFNFVIVMSVIMIITMVCMGIVNNVQAEVMLEEFESIGAIVYSNVDIESPSIIFNVDKYVMFKLMFKEIGPNIYRTGNNFYLFSSDYQIAYRFSIIPFHAITGIK